MRGRAPVILIVDDEPETVKYLKANLAARGYHVLSAADGLEGLKVFSERPVDLVLLDISMPGIDGLRVCERIRQVSQVPIIILSASGREQDKVAALDMGADGYLTKPFGVLELLARVRAALRRVPGASGSGDQHCRFGDYELDMIGRRLLFRGEEIRVTPTEFSLLCLLVKNAGKVLTRRSILASLWGPEYVDEEQYLWAYVRRLRHKLRENARSPRFIFTEPGVGYRFTTDVMRVS